MDTHKEEALRDTMNDMADHMTAALRDAAEGKVHSAAVNREFAQADCDRAVDLLNDIIESEGNGQ